MRGVAHHVGGLIKIYLDKVGEYQVVLTCEIPVVLIRDYIESMAELGRAVPADARAARSARADPIGIRWPLGNTLVVPASSTDSNEAHNQAPATPLDALRKIKEISQIGRSARLIVLSRQESPL